MHKASLVVCVLNAQGQRVMESMVLTIPALGPIRVTYLLAAVTLSLWKKGMGFDRERLNSQTV